MKSGDRSETIDAINLRVCACERQGSGVGIMGFKEIRARNLRTRVKNKRKARQNIAKQYPIVGISIGIIIVPTRSRIIGEQIHQAHPEQKPALTSAGVSP
jgi:hypothetical protein